VKIVPELADQKRVSSSTCGKESVSVFGWHMKFPKQLFFSFRRDRAKSPQETVNAGLRSRFGANWTDVRPIQKREFCFCHDGTFIALADTPREYCDRCVGDRVHKKVVLVFWALGPLPVTHQLRSQSFRISHAKITITVLQYDFAPKGIPSCYSPLPELDR
jgi:hypothetical protein